MTGFWKKSICLHNEALTIFEHTAHVQLFVSGSSGMLIRSIKKCVHDGKLNRQPKVQHPQWQPPDL